jgi:hypothetical protein
MNTPRKTLFIAIAFLIFGILSCKKISDVIPADIDGSASATINGTSWDATYAGALTSGTATQIFLSIVIEKDPKDKNTDKIAIGITYPKAETGIKTYASGTSTPVTLFSITYQGKSYTTAGIGLTGIVTNLKITENTPSKSLLEPGKIVGEFSATLKTSDNKETITITNGKFTGIRAL